ncbi:MAG: glycosyltransferase [Candidatus Theseobacter exili]|nr:glycosyltransferase [Candidatus Theseobacter exili]
MIKACCNNGWQAHYFSSGKFPISNPKAIYYSTPGLGNKSWLIAAYYLLILPFKILLTSRKEKIDLFLPFGLVYTFILSIPHFILRIPVITFIRSNWIEELQLAQKNKLVIILARLIIHIGAASSDLIVVNSETLKIEISKILGHRMGKKIKVLYNNIDPLSDSDLIKLRGNKHLFLKKLGITGNPFIIGYSGTLKPRKEITLLIKAFQKTDINNTILIIVGSGSEENNLKQLVKELSIESRIFFVGWQEDPIPIVACFDLMVHPTKFEGCPNSILDALTCEVPCIASDVTGVTDVLNEKELLFPPSDENAIVDRMKSIITDQQVYYRISELSKKQKQKLCFDWDKKLVDLCNNLLGENEN